MRVRLREEPKIRARLFSGRDLTWSRSLAEEGLIPFLHSNSQKFVCVWCDVVVGEFHSFAELASYVAFHKKLFCQKPEQKDTPADDLTLCRLRLENARDHLAAAAAECDNITRLIRAKRWSAGPTE